MHSILFRHIRRISIAGTIVLTCVVVLSRPAATKGQEKEQQDGREQQGPTDTNAQALVTQGRHTFRYDTFGDEAFWGGQLHLNEAVASGLSPQTALTLGLKVDVNALPQQLVQKLRKGQVDLTIPSTTVSLLRMDAVVGLTGVFDSSGTQLTSIGIQCALCHSTVNDSLMPGIGSRLDGWANHDLNIGAIVALAPNLQPVADVLGTDVATVRQVLNSWGPGKFDAELFLDGKAFNPKQVSHGVTTGTNVSGAAMIPNAFGLAGYNQHTWTGAWGTVSYWNALVANLEMHGQGTFFDPRLDNASQFPVAARNRFGHTRTAPDDDRITSKLPALHFFQLALPAPKPTPGVDFDAASAARGDALFEGKAGCNNCHVESLWTEPGWNLHTPGEIGIDSFEADRAPDHVYKSQNLAGLFVQERGLFMQAAHKGRFYHDGRFPALLDVVNHYNIQFNLGLSNQDKLDLVEYLKSL